jgi:hypothetical protein
MGFYKIIVFLLIQIFLITNINVADIFAQKYDCLAPSSEIPQANQETLKHEIEELEARVVSFKDEQKVLEQEKQRVIIFLDQRPDQIPEEEQKKAYRVLKQIVLGVGSLSFMGLGGFGIMKIMSIGLSMVATGAVFVGCIMLFGVSFWLLFVAGRLGKQKKQGKKHKRKHKKKHKRKQGKEQEQSVLEERIQEVGAEIIKIEGQREVAVSQLNLAKSTLITILGERSSMLQEALERESQRGSLLGSSIVAEEDVRSDSDFEVFGNHFLVSSNLGGAEVEEDFEEEESLEEEPQGVEVPMSSQVRMAAPEVPMPSQGRVAEAGVQVQDQTHFEEMEQTGQHKKLSRVQYEMFIREKQKLERAMAVMKVYYEGNLKTLEARIEVLEADQELEAGEDEAEYQEVIEGLKSQQTEILDQTHLVLAGVLMKQAEAPIRIAQMSAVVEAVKQERDEVHEKLDLLEKTLAEVTAAFKAYKVDEGEAGVALFLSEEEIKRFEQLTTDLEALTRTLEKEREEHGREIEQIEINQEIEFGVAQIVDSLIFKVDLEQQLLREQMETQSRIAEQEEAKAQEIAELIAKQSSEIVRQKEELEGEQGKVIEALRAEQERAIAKLTASYSGDIAKLRAELEATKSEEIEGLRVEQASELVARAAESEGEIAELTREKDEANAKLEEVISQKERIEDVLKTANSEKDELKAGQEQLKTEIRRVTGEEKEIELNLNRLQAEQERALQNIASFLQGDDTRISRVENKSLDEQMGALIVEISSQQEELQRNVAAQAERIVELERELDANSVKIEESGIVQRREVETNKALRTEIVELTEAKGSNEKLIRDKKLLEIKLKEVKVENEQQKEQIVKFVEVRHASSEKLEKLRAELTSKTEEIKRLRYDIKSLTTEKEALVGEREIHLAKIESLTRSFGQRETEVLRSYEEETTGLRLAHRKILEEKDKEYKMTLAERVAEDEEARAVLEVEHAKVIKDLEAKHESILAEKATEHEGVVTRLTAEQSKAITELRAELEANKAGEIEGLKAKHKSVLVARAAESEGALTRLREEQATAIAELRAKLEALTQEKAKAIQSLEAKHESILAVRATEHEGALTRLREEQVMAIAELRAELEANKAGEIEVLEAKHGRVLAEKAKAIAELSTNIDTLTRDKEVTAAQLKVSIAAQAKAEASLQEIETQKDEIQAQLSRSQEAQEQVVIEKDRLKTENEVIQSKLSSLTTAKQETESKLGSRTEEHQQVVAEVSVLQQERIGIDEKINKVERDVQSYQKQLREAGSDREALREEKGKLQEEIDKVKRSLDKEMRNSREIGEILDENRVKIEELVAELASQKAAHEEKLTLMQQELEEQARKIRESESESETEREVLRETIARQEQKINDEQLKAKQVEDLKTSELEKLKAEKEKLKERMSAVQSSLSKEEEKTRKLRDAQQRLQAKESFSKMAIESLTRDNLKLTKEKLALRKEAERKGKEIEQQKQRNSLLSVEIEALKTELRNQARIERSLRDDFNNSEERVKERDLEISELNVANEKLVEEKDELNQEMLFNVSQLEEEGAIVADLRVEVEGFQDQLEKQQGAYQILSEEKDALNTQLEHQRAEQAANIRHAENVLTEKYSIELEEKEREKAKLKILLTSELAKAKETFDREIEGKQAGFDRKIEEAQREYRKKEEALINSQREEQLRRMAAYETATKAQKEEHAREIANLIAKHEKVLREKEFAIKTQGSSGEETEALFNQELLRLEGKLKEEKAAMQASHSEAIKSLEEIHAEEIATKAEEQAGVMLKIQKENVGQLASLNASKQKQIEEMQAKHEQEKEEMQAGHDALYAQQDEVRDKIREDRLEESRRSVDALDLKHKTRFDELEKYYGYEKERLIKQHKKKLAKEVEQHEEARDEIEIELEEAKRVLAEFKETQQVKDEDFKQQYSVRLTEWTNMLENRNGEIEQQRREIRELTIRQHTLSRELAEKTKQAEQYPAIKAENGLIELELEQLRDEISKKDRRIKGLEVSVRNLRLEQQKLKTPASAPRPGAARRFGAAQTLQQPVFATAPRPGAVQTPGVAQTPRAAQTPGRYAYIDEPEPEPDRKHIIFPQARLEKLAREAKEQGTPKPDSLLESPGTPKTPAPQQKVAVTAPVRRIASSRGGMASGRGPRTAYKPRIRPSLQGSSKVPGSTSISRVRQSTANRSEDLFSGIKLPGSRDERSSYLREKVKIITSIEYTADMNQLRNKGKREKIKSFLRRIQINIVNREMNNVIEREGLVISINKLFYDFLEADEYLQSEGKKGLKEKILFYLCRKEIFEIIAEKVSASGGASAFENKDEDFFKGQSWEADKFILTGKFREYLRDKQLAVSS